MRHVLAYRDRYQITDSGNALGPGSQQGERGEAHAIAARALKGITATGDTKPRPAARSRLWPMERVPALLADAERGRGEADERARRDHADREYERAPGRTW